MQGMLSAWLETCANKTAGSHQCDSNRTLCFTLLQKVTAFAWTLEGIIFKSMKGQTFKEFDRELYSPLHKQEQVGRVAGYAAWMLGGLAWRTE
jgi:hypothetical protein